MATAAVHTPIKSHSSIFSTRTAGGRMPLTASPRSRQNSIHGAQQRSNSNQSPFTPPQRNSIHSREPSGQSTYQGSLASHFSSLALGSGKKASYKNSPKCNIARPNVSPIKLELGVSDWALTGTGTTVGQTPVKKRKGKTTIRMQGDRFIPTRSASSPTAAAKAEFKRPTSSSSTRSESSDSIFSTAGDDFALGSSGQAYTGNQPDSPAKNQDGTPTSAAYKSSIASAVGLNLNTRVLAFKPTAPESSRPIDLRSQYNRPLRPAASAQSRRRYATAPERVLDAPGLVDDYYLNLLDWGSSNMVAIGLEHNVYIWNASTGNVSCLLETPGTHITSVKWSQDGGFVAVGLATGEVQIWDPEESSKVRSMVSHGSRVGVMSWNKHILSSGARSGDIVNHDVRIAQHQVATLSGHTSEVCGLEWRADGAQLGSGGNDNLVNIWDARALNAPRFTKTNHKAAVKALAWCPWQTNLLATGGGSSDKFIHFWNSTTGARVNSIDTGSQVTSLRWSPHYKEIVSCHGFPDNQLCVWSYPSLAKFAEIPAHETRVLHSTLSPDGQVLATAASDESLKFWKLFEKKGAPGLSALRDGANAGKGSELVKQMTIR